MRAALALLPLAAAILAPGAAPARASCLQSIAVDGRILVGAGDPAPGAPEPAGRANAIDLACNDVGGRIEPDRRIEVMRLRDVPPDVGVVHQGTLYVARGTLASARGHPLRTAFPRARRGNCRPHRTPLRGPANSADSAGLAIGPVRIAVDRGTRIGGAPVEQPVTDGQRLLVRASLCGGERVADRITFLPPVLEADRYVANFESRSSDRFADRFPLWAVLLLGGLPLLLIAAAGLPLRRA